MGGSLARTQTRPLSGRMKTIIDDDRALVTLIDDDGREQEFPFESPEAFSAVSKAWVRIGWIVKHLYSFTWMGRPIIQLPDDMVRFQEVIYTERPDVLIETGIAHGGSLIFYASLFAAMGHGRVIGIDIELRAHNRSAIEAHEMADRITLIDGSSTAPDTLDQVRQLIKPGEKVMVVLDSNHTRSHVLDELRAYSDLVPVGGYLVATDGIMRDLAKAPRSQPDWETNNPFEAARAFVAENDAFEIVEPEWLFNEGIVRERVTHWPGCYVRRVR